MNLSRRSLLTSLIAAPAIISIDNLMPVRLWVPTIYGDAVHDDWPGMTAWLKGERVNILPRGFGISPDCYHFGEGVFRMSKPLCMPPNHSAIGKGEKTIIKGDVGLPFVMGWEQPLAEGQKLGQFSIRSSDGFGIVKNLFSEK